MRILNTPTFAEGPLAFITASSSPLSVDVARLHRLLPAQIEFCAPIANYLNFLFGHYLLFQNLFGLQISTLASAF